MAQIAIKWDNDYIRVAVANNARGAARAQFDRALAVELTGEHESLSPAQMGEKLKVILEKVGVQRGDATVIVARRDVEMRQFQLPPVPPEELPDMVRFQARNHFTSFNEDCLVDFVPLSTNEEHATVLAAALSAEESKNIRDTVEAAGLKLRHIVLRPFAAAELVRGAKPDSDCRIVLEMIGREADISVVDNGYVLMTRTVRVPDTYTTEQFDAWMPGEIRRTITAARGQSGAGKACEIIVCGSKSDHPKLADELNESFDAHTEFLPPFDLVQTSNRFERPAHDDGFASLLGALVQAKNTESHALDFLHPRKRPEKKLDKKKIYWAAAIAASIGLIGLMLVWSMFKSKDRQIATLEESIAKLEKTTSFTDPVVANAKPLDEFNTSRVDWLEKMYSISQIVPEPENTRLTRIVGANSRY